MKTRLTSFCIAILTLLSCHTGKTATCRTGSADRNILFTAGPKAIVYKTTKDYSRNVPVMMNQERTRIISYPAPSDVYYKGGLALPTPLAGGYLLDNRGIGANVAFLDYTYQEYVRLENILSAEELTGHILDKYPLTALWDCGARAQYKNEVKELNKVIETGFSGCKKIEITSIILQKDPYN